MYTFLIIIHVLIAILLIVTVLMQTDKGNALGGTFGGSMGCGNLFGARTAATMLSKFTTGLAVAFFAVTFLITIASVPGSQGQNKSVISERANRNTAPAANLPAPQGDMPVNQAQQQAQPQQPVQQPQQPQQQTEN